MNSSRQINYFSFGSSDEFSLKRQLVFCEALAKFVECEFNFFCFTFPEEEIIEDDRVNLVPMDQWNDFFKVFQPNYNKDTVVFNHAFFHSYLGKFLRGENTSFLYHKLDVEFLFLKKIGTQREVYEKHAKLESELLQNCDWMYTSSNLILKYFQENKGYHQHKYSKLPSLDIGQRQLEYFKVDDSEKVEFVHLGPISNRGIKYIKKILIQPNNRVTVLSDEVKSIQRQGFSKDERFSVLKYTEANLHEVLPKMDYALIRPKSDVSSWIRAEKVFPTLLQYGIRLLLPKDYDISVLVALAGSISLESSEFDLPKIEKIERKKNAEEASAFFDLNEIQNSLKFRNAHNIHNRLVSKIK